MKFELPGGRVVRLRTKPKPKPRKASTPSDLFGGARALFAEILDFDPGTLSLAEFHALRAIATHERWLEEEEIEIECRNCDAPMRVRPCAAMPIAPFSDAELDDEELDATLDLEAAHDVPKLGAVRLAPRTAAEAAPLHRALARATFDVTAEVVRAMGVVAIGEKRDPRAIARVLQRCDDRAFAAIERLFLDAHYPPRLFGLAVCESCGTRNDVDAPYDREFAPAEDDAPRADEPLPTFDAFDALAKRIAEPLLAEAPGPPVQLVIEGGVPACDDGGEPLLGSYVPAQEADARNPANPGEITLYYRTFAAMWKEDGPYDLEAEVTETIEHELEHHAASLVGHDPKDEEERDEIAREARRVIGRKAVVRASAGAFAGDLREFWRRTWIVWILVLIAAAIAVMAQK
ncbi:MAG TPA: metallopeptidase family protein [Polyangiaceae bacterium]|jgi:hypothetical protein